MYIYLAAQNADTMKQGVVSLADASGVMREYIERFGLGSSHLKKNCGRVYENNKQVARVSYNGRVWDMQDKEILV